MGNAIYKLHVFHNFLDIIFKKIQTNFSKSRSEKRIFELLKTSKTNIDLEIPSTKFKEFDLDKEPIWEFSLKNWS